MTKLSRPRPERLAAGDRRTLAACVGLTAVLCLAGLTSRSLWIDEAVALRIAQTPGWSVLMSDGGNMPAYYLLLRAWTVFGDSLQILRLPSALFATAAVVFGYLLAFRLFGGRVAAISGVLLAVNSSLVTYGQEARSYAMTLMLVTAAWLVLDVALERRTVPWFLLWGTLNALAVASHLFSVFLVAAQLASLAAVARRELPVKGLLGGVGVTVLGSAPFLAAAAGRGDVQIDWIPPTSAAAFRQVMLFLGGANFEPSPDLFPRLIALLVLAICAVGWLAGIRIAIQSVRDNGPSQVAWAHAVPAIWLTVPLAGATVASLAAHPLLVPRFFVALIPAGCMLLALALSKVRPGPVAYAGLAALVVLGLSGVVRSYGYTDWEWREVAGYLNRAAGPGEAVIVLPGRQMLALDYALTHAPAAPAFKVISPEQTPWRPPEATVYGVSDAFVRTNSPAGAAAEAAGRQRFWVVTSDFTRFDGSGRVQEAFDEAGTFFRTLGPGFVVRSAEAFGTAGGPRRIGVLLIEREAS
jgi:4-amino-4-deoxy-L-arabinose transferase-like glycosyltransferase